MNRWSEWINFDPESMRYLGGWVNDEPEYDEPDWDAINKGRREDEL